MIFFAFIPFFVSFCFCCTHIPLFKWWYIDHTRDRPAGLVDERWIQIWWTVSLSLQVRWRIASSNTVAIDLTTRLLNALLFVFFTCLLTSVDFTWATKSLCQKEAYHSIYVEIGRSRWWHKTSYFRFGREICRIYESYVYGTDRTFFKRKPVNPNDQCLVDERWLQV